MNISIKPSKILVNLNNEYILSDILVSNSSPEK